MVHKFAFVLLSLLSVGVIQVVISGVIERAAGFPQSPEKNKQQWIKSNKFQGDISNYDHTTFKKLINDVTTWQTHRRNKTSMDRKSLSSAISDPRGLWLNGIVPYVISSKDPNVATAVNAAIADFQAKTCIKFVSRTQEDNYVDINDLTDGCYSMLGNIRQGGQKLNLGEGCKTKGTALHELNHAIGFWHEQQRYDRDNYIIVYTENIEQSQQSQYEIAGDDKMKLIGNYDLDSVMHYPSWGFALPGKITMKAKNSDRTDFGGEQLTDEDVKKIRELYNCADETKHSQTIESGSVYYVKPESTNNCLDVPFASKDVVQLQQWDCNGTPAQEWIITRVKDDTYTITNVGNNMAMEVFDSELKNDVGSVGQAPAKNPSTQNQQFLLKARDGKFHLTAAINGRILWFDTNGKLFHWKGDAGQNWSLEKVVKVTKLTSGSIYCFKADYEGCMSGPTAGGQIQESRCDGSKAQQWKITLVKNDTYTLTNVGNNLNMEVLDSELKNDVGSVVQAPAKPDSPLNQQFVLKPRNGNFHLTTAINGRIVWPSTGLFHWKGDAGQDWIVQQCGK